MSVGVAMKSSMRVSVHLGFMVNVFLHMSSSPPRRVTTTASLVTHPHCRVDVRTFAGTHTTHRRQWASVMHWETGSVCRVSGVRRTCLVWTCLAPSATPPVFLCTLSVASGCLCYIKVVRTELDILHRPALLVRGARSAWRATEPPPNPTTHPRKTAARPDSRDSRTPPTHLPVARLVPETPQAARRQPDRQQCTWAPRVVSGN